MKTTYHAYYFDTSKPEQAAQWKKLKKKLTDAGYRKFHALTERTMCDKSLDGKEIELDDKHLYNNQWNTKPIPGKSETGLRIFDWAQDYIWTVPAIKTGHWIDLTPEMREARRNTCACGYCGKQEPAAKGYVFCPHCLGSEYLTVENLPLTRMAPVDVPLCFKRAPLTDAEQSYLLPLYRKAQLHGATAGDKARIAELRRGIEETYRAKTTNAKHERDGLIWLMDRGVKTDNVIYYAHKGQFCFGWRKPLDPTTKSDLLDIISEFPFDYEIK